MLAQKLSHSLVALITPMDRQGNIDYDTLQRLINRQIAAGTAGVVILGTTGEFATLTPNERMQVVKKSVQFAAGHLPVIAGVGLNSTAAAVDFVQQLEQWGVDGCLTVTPFYNKPTQCGLIHHFTAIAHSSALPHILYNVPSRTGCDLAPETVVQLAKLPNIIGLKDASGNLSRVGLLRHLIGEQFILLSGDDENTVDFMRLGGDGVISVSANLVAKQMATLCQLVVDGQYSAARQLHHQLLPLHQALFIETNPIPVKWAAYRLGLLTSDSLRLPLTPLSLAAQPAVQQALHLVQKT